MADAAERVRCQVEADVETLRQRLRGDSDEVVTRLNTASDQLRRHHDALNELVARCSHVNTINLIQRLRVFCFHHRTRAVGTIDIMNMTTTKLMP